MNRKMKEKQKKAMIRDWVFLGISIIVTGVLMLIFPDKREAMATSSWRFFTEMIWILPAVMILMGLFAVWVPQETVVKYLGKSSGIKGIALALIFGALPTGPLYIAFPLAAGLIKKGARVSNIVIFLSAWACIKIPQEMVELQFLGAKFMTARLVLTIVFVIIMGISIEKITEWQKKTGKIRGSEDDANI